MKYSKIFVSAILAGICIAFGGTIYLSMESKVLGALLFTVGLFAVCTFGLQLFTGKAAYMFQQDKRYNLGLPIIWLGNFVGAALVAFLVRQTRIDTIAEKATAVCQTKLDDSLLSLFILGLFCNIFIYIAVEGFKNNPHELGKYLALFLGVMVFILCGFEHCVADMYYFAVAGIWSGDMFLRLVIITLGNIAGGVIFPLARSWLNKEEKQPTMSK